MKIHFGTDGIRGRANENLTIDMAYRIGRYLGNYFPKGTILIGRDTRLSGGMFEMALAAGATAGGCDAYLLGVCSTPSLIYLVTAQKFDCGIMITASHNPYHDNGIKVIASDGKKLSSDIEKAMEEYIYGAEDTLPLMKGEDIGQIFDYKDGLNKYIEHLKEEFPEDLSGMTVCVDCSNGSNIMTAAQVLRSLGCTVDVINDKPNGLNINRDCGSTHIEALVEKVKAGQYDCGFAYDGDADRVIAVDGEGNVVDGDKMIYVIGCYLKKHDMLNGNKVVVTVMSNLGFFKAMDKVGIGYEKTAVGDKYVYQCMGENDYKLGGEQSGHVIVADKATTGDGLLTSLLLLQIIKEENKSLKNLTADFKTYPQLLINVEVKNKEKAIKDEEVQAVCKEVEEKLADEGRVLVRTSGTEPIVRVMVEASSQAICEKYCNQIVNKIKERNL